MGTSHSLFCKGCWQHMRLPIPIRGPFSLPLRLLGVKISRMNPNLCTICETMFTKVKRRKQIIIPATVLFADLRGYTTISEAAPSGDVVNMLHGFYDGCASAIWERDGIVNKFIGDAVLAIFNFPIMREDHVQQAVTAALDIQKRCSQRKGWLWEVRPWVSALESIPDQHQSAKSAWLTKTLPLSALWSTRHRGSRARPAQERSS